MCISNSTSMILNNSNDHVISLSHMEMKVNFVTHLWGWQVVKWYWVSRVKLWAFFWWRGIIIRLPSGMCRGDNTLNIISSAIQYIKKMWKNGLTMITFHWAQFWGDLLEILAIWHNICCRINQPTNMYRQWLSHYNMNNCDTCMEPELCGLLYQSETSVVPL